MNTQDTKELHCLKCKHILDMATAVNSKDNKIIPDISFTVCGYCGEIMLYTEKDGQLALRSPRIEELHSFSVKQPRMFDQLVKLSALFRAMNVPNFIKPDINKN